MALMRLQRFLAQCGVASRRKAELLILDGSVSVNGTTSRTLGVKVDPEHDRVTVDGRPVRQEDFFYAVFNKPKGCITAISDPDGRRTVMEFMPGLPASVMPVGRLDFYTEGVLLLTNDGTLAAALTSSRREVEKVYHVKVKGKVSEQHIRQLQEGVRLDARVTTKPAQVERLKAQSSHDWLSVTITEGRNRQLHRMAEALGHEIIKLHRVSFAGVSFHGLRVGDARELNQNEMKDLYAAADLPVPKGVVSRGKWAVKRETTEKARRSADRGRERVTPNLTPGGSKRAKAKLLERYREQEEDGTAPDLPAFRASQHAKRGGVYRPAKSKLVVGARPKPARGTSYSGGAAGKNNPARKESSSGSSRGGRARAQAKPPGSKRRIASGGRKQSSRKNATSKSRRT